MLDPNGFVDNLIASGIKFVTGVPDSLLKDVCACFTNKLQPTEHIIATNEGSAVGLAIGHFLATSSVPLIYMQNSGLGNTINPLTSLADEQVYGIPLILLIGWRGEISKENIQLKDEPQHVKQGQITLDQLELLGIPYFVLDNTCSDSNDIILRSIETARNKMSPVAIVVRKGTFSSSSLEIQRSHDFPLSRESAIKCIVSIMPAETSYVSTTGKASRELYELRQELSASNCCNDFLTVGGMGHASQIAAGIALSRPSRTIACIDGDGALLMHMGALAISSDCDNLMHILINNESHESVGGQPTKGNRLDFATIAKNCGYKFTANASTRDELIYFLRKFKDLSGSRFIEIKCNLFSRSDLGRPKSSPFENKTKFMSSFN